MSIDMIITIAVIVVAAVAIGFVAHRRVPRRLKTTKFVTQWKELQGQLGDKTNWPKALEEADKLLDKALKKRRFKGKSMGERMVSAQKKISNNDAMWFAHNLYKKVVADPTVRLKETDVKAALIGYRNALKDIGALATPKQPPAEPEEEKKS